MEVAASRLWSHALMAKPRPDCPACKGEGVVSECRIVGKRDPSDFEPSVGASGPELTTQSLAGFSSRPVPCECVKDQWVAEERDRDG